MLRNFLPVTTFGSHDLKRRVKSISHFQKSRPWTALLAAILALMVGACTMTGAENSEASASPPQSGSLGTIKTATQGAEQDGILYFLWNTGPVYAPVSVAAYDMDTGEFAEKIAIPDTDILSFQIAGDNAYCLTETAVWRCSLDGAEQTVLAQTDENGQFSNAWMFLLKDELYLCRSNMGTETAVDEGITLQILALSTLGELRLISEQESAKMDGLKFYLPSLAAYWDGCLYARNVAGDRLYTLNLYTGEVQTANRSTQGIFALSDGLYIRESGVDGVIQRMDGGVFLENPPGNNFLGGDGENLYFLNNRYGVQSAIFRTGPNGSESLTDTYSTDMTTDITAYIAGDCVLFLTTEDLTGDAGQDGMLHYLYLLKDGEILKIASYTQDYLYC